MTRETEEGGRRVKRRRWKTRRPNPKPELILPPEMQLAFTGSLSRSYLRSYIAAVNQVSKELYKRDVGGDHIAVLEAIDLCSAFLPPWVRERFHEALERYRRHDVKTFDEALGIKRPKGGITSRRVRVSYCVGKSCSVSTTCISRVQVNLSMPRCLPLSDVI